MRRTYSTHGRPVGLIFISVNKIPFKVSVAVNSMFYKFPAI